MLDVHETLIELELSTAAGLAARTGHALERVYADLVHLEAAGLAEIVCLSRGRSHPLRGWAPIPQSGAMP